MRASLIGRFLLLAILWLMLLLPLWYWAARWLAVPAIWLAGTVMQGLFSWVDGWAQDGVRGGVVLLGDGPEIDVDEL